MLCNYGIKSHKVLLRSFSVLQLHYVMHYIIYFTFTQLRQFTQ